MTLHVTITEYTTSLGDVVEKKKAYIKINEFDIGGTINSKVTGIGSLLVGDGVGSLADFPWVADGMVLTSKVSEPLKVKWIAPTVVEATMTNRSGVDMEVGTVCILHATANSITTTTIASDRRIFCVTAEAIADLSTGRVVFYGVATVKVTGAVAVGQWLVTSATASRAKAVGYTKPIGAIGMATTANASGNGTVTCVLAIDLYLSISAGKGYLQGNGTASNLNQILSFITETTAAGTALPGNHSMSQGLASPSVGYAMAAATYKTPFATDTPAAAATANEVTAQTYQGATGISDASKGIVAGGITTGTVAQKNTFATETTTLVAGANLSTNRRDVSGMTDTLNGYFCGGYTAAVVATGDKTSLTTETTAAVASTNLTAGRTGAPSISKIGSFGYWCGGYEAAKVSKVDKTLFASDTTSASTALAAARSFGGGLSAANSGYSCGGGDAEPVSGGTVTGVESVSFATDTFAALGGAVLGTAQYGMCAISTIN